MLKRLWDQRVLAALRKDRPVQAQRNHLLKAQLRKDHCLVDLSVDGKLVRGKNQLLARLILAASLIKFSAITICTVSELAQELAGETRSVGFRTRWSARHMSTTVPSKRVSTSDLTFALTH